MVTAVDPLDHANTNRDAVNNTTNGPATSPERNTPNRVHGR